MENNSEVVFEDEIVPMSPDEANSLYVSPEAPQSNLIRIDSEKEEEEESSRIFGLSGEDTQGPVSETKQVKDSAGPLISRFLKPSPISEQYTAGPRLSGDESTPSNTKSSSLPILIGVIIAFGIVVYFLKRKNRKPTLVS
jgi:hypothetical protein